MPDAFCVCAEGCDQSLNVTYNVKTKSHVPMDVAAPPHLSTLRTSETAMGYPAMTLRYSKWASSSASTDNMFGAPWMLDTNEIRRLALKSTSP